MVEVLINNVITSISFIFKIFVISVVTIDDTITVSDISLGVFGLIFVHSIFPHSNGVVQLIIIFLVKLDVCPLLHESGIVNNVIITIKNVLNFFIIIFITVGELITLPVDLRVKLNPLMDKSSIVNDVIISILNILDLLVVILVSICKFIGLSSNLNPHITLWSINVLHCLNLGS
jgi:hypothetical protein